MGRITRTTTMRRIIFRANGDCPRGWGTKHFTSRGRLVTRGKLKSEWSGGNRNVWRKGRRRESSAREGEEGETLEEFVRGELRHPFRMRGSFKFGGLQPGVSAFGLDPRLISGIPPGCEAVTGPSRRSFWSYHPGFADSPTGSGPHQKRSRPRGREAFLSLGLADGPAIAQRAKFVGVDSQIRTQNLIGMLAEG